MGYFQSKKKQPELRLLFAIQIATKPGFRQRLL